MIKTMKKELSLICCLFCFSFSNAQSQIEYFPQEQLIHPNNSTEQNHNTYLFNDVKNKMISILSQKKNLSAFKKYRNDTINFVLGFIVDTQGRLILEKSDFNCSKSKLLQKFDDDMKEILASLPKFEIINRKPEPVISHHFLYYRFALQGKKSPVLEYIPSADEYLGGVIQEIPIFPGCENLSQEETAQCLQSMMEQHIAKNFIYPSDAYENRISGTVNVVMDITEDGITENLRVLGRPHGSLRKEAFRIIKLLPKMQPGKRNGKPDEFTYSIPVIFQL